MLKIGLTGGVGSGKSTVAKMFKALGAPVYTADLRAKELQNKEPLRSRIKSAFGNDIYQNDILNRAELAKIVFNDKEKLTALNNLVHPAVAKDYATWLSQQKASYIIKEAAIIFEIGAEKQYDKVILVTAPENLRINRVMQRDGSSKEQVQSRINNQLTDDEKSKQADFIIQNIDLATTQKQVQKLHKLLQNA